MTSSGAMAFGREGDRASFRRVHIALAYRLVQLIGMETRLRETMSLHGQRLPNKVRSPRQSRSRARRHLRTGSEALTGLNTLNVFRMQTSTGMISGTGGETKCPSRPIGIWIGQRRSAVWGLSHSRLTGHTVNDRGNRPPNIAVRPRNVGPHHNL